MGSIKPLAEGVKSAVRSGFIIGGLTTVVEELMYNSLDAGATQVSVHVGVNNGYVKVEDNGSGISRDGLVLVGERYATSKHHQFHDKDDDNGSFGFRGEVLCSIADISLVEIVSKVNGRANGYQKVMKGRKCLYFGIDNYRRDAGTTVIVRDLFYNQPVRRRQMQSSVKKVLHSVKECTVRIALVQPRISFRVVDMESEDELLLTHASSTRLSLLLNNFGIAASSLHELSFSRGFLKIEGYISSPSGALPSKAIQYIYVNSRFVVKGPIHKILNHLADMCWNQLSGDNSGNRDQTTQGPIYCLNLRCPRSSYDLNLEFSRTSVEFKDWSTVIAFIEESVASLWNKKRIMGEGSECEAYRLGNSVEEKIPGNKTSVEEDWLLRTCKRSTKRRRKQNSGNDQGFPLPSPQSTKRHVEDDCDLPVQQASGRQHRKSQRKVKFKESDIERKLCNMMDSAESYSVSPSPYFVMENIGDHVWDSDKGLMSFNEDLLENDVTIRKGYGNHGEGCSRWSDELKVGDADAKGSEVNRKWSFVSRHETTSNEDINDSKKFLHDLVLDLNNNSRSQTHIFNAKRSCGNSKGNTDVDGWPLPKFNKESAIWSDLINSSTNCDNLLSSGKEYIDIEHPSQSPSKQAGICSNFSLDTSDKEYIDIEYTSKSLSKQDGNSSNSFSLEIDQHSAVLYPFLSTWELEHRHLMSDVLQSRCNVRKSKKKHSKEHEGELYCDYLCDRHNYESYSSTSHLNSSSPFQTNYARVVKGVGEFSPQGYSFHGITPTRFGEFCEEIPLQCMNLREGDYRHFQSEYQSRLKSLIAMGRFEALDSDFISTESFHRQNQCCSPDGLLSSKCYDAVADETFSPYLVYQRRNSHGLSIPCLSPASIDDGPNSDLQQCQVPESDFSISERTGREFVRSRRRHSAPPVYRGKRRFLSVMDCLLSTADDPNLLASSQDYVVKGNRELEHPPGLPLINSELHQQYETSYTKKSSYCIDQDVKETCNVTVVDTWPQTETVCCSPGSLKQVHDLEKSEIKGPTGFKYVKTEDLTNKQRMGDMFDKAEEVNEILDVHSCMLCLSGDSLVPKAINRNCLESTKVLLQVDCKFIPVVASGTLVVIDQHAADERIRLEEMRQKVLSGEMKSVTYLQEEKDLVLPEMTYQLLCNYAEHIQNWGWKCNIFTQNSGFAKNLNVLNARPNHLRLLAVPCILGVSLSDGDLLEFLEQLADTDGSSTIPPSVLRILNYKACRGAIMFGDKLLPSECSLIVEELKKTSLCFQCAHGRPTTVPLVNLKALHEGIAQLRSWRNGRSNDSWHGLCREDINIRRAKHRLDVARGCG